MFCSYLEEEEESIDEAKSGVSQEEEDEIGAFGIHKASREVGHEASVASLPAPDHDDNRQEEEDLRLPHVQLTLLRPDSKQQRADGPSELGKPVPSTVA